MPPKDSIQKVMEKFDKIWDEKVEECMNERSYRGYKEIKSFLLISLQKIQSETEKRVRGELEELKERKPKCFRCNDGGCPACDGTKGSKYNPEPY